jgi:hypothetical protein
MSWRAGKGLQVEGAVTHIKRDRAFFIVWMFETT